LLDCISYYCKYIFNLISEVQSTTKTRLDAS